MFDYCKGFSMDVIEWIEILRIIFLYYWESEIF